jgi:hypothetical protein
MTENCKFHKAILSAFYNISQRNFGILLILWCSFKLWWKFCLDQNFSYKVKGPFKCTKYFREDLTLVLEDAQCFNYISEPSSEIRKTSFILIYPDSRAWFPLAWKIRLCRFCVLFLSSMLCFQYYVKTCQSHLYF